MRGLPISQTIGERHRLQQAQEQAMQATTDIEMLLELCAEQQEEICMLELFGGDTE